MTTDTDPERKTATVTVRGVTTREVDGDEQEVLRVPISSTRPDRENDRFDKDALEDMAAQIEREQPHVFDNHGLAGSFMEAIPYDSRETIGTQFDAEVDTKEDGEAELFAFVNPDGTHPEGERMLKQVRDEAQAIKFSVGFAINGYEDREDVEGDFEGDGRIFTSADLMETSRVGIPANPDASLAVAKDGSGEGGVAPGFQMHPFFARMYGEGGGAVAKDAVTDGGVSETVTELREELADLREKVEGGCDEDADCPDGEVCVDGECVPEEDLEDDEDDDDDDDDEDDDEDEETASCPECDSDVPDSASYCPSCGESLETDDATPDDGKAAEIERLESELEDLRAAVNEGTASPDTKDTTTEEPDLTNDGEPDADADANTDDAEPNDHETIL
jgi:hypothetical protein